ncbi:hypothetical protein HDU93_010053 [Gonapodya sp. JEL0774]|nr:hypothetical protein HDU93_010053 [Gonapodya sp. JEL0774]
MLGNSLTAYPATTSASASDGSIVAEDRLRYDFTPRDPASGTRVWAVPVIIREYNDTERGDTLELLVRVPFESFWNGKHSQIRHQAFKDAHELLTPPKPMHSESSKNDLFPALSGGALMPFFGPLPQWAPEFLADQTKDSSQEKRTGVAIEFFNVRYAVRIDGPKELVEKGCPEDAVLTFVPYAYDKHGVIANLVTSASASAQPMCVLEWKDSPSPIFTDDDTDYAGEAEERLESTVLAEFVAPTVHKIRTFAEEISTEQQQHESTTGHILQGEMSAWLGKACWGRFGRAPAVAFELSYSNYESISDTLCQLPGIIPALNTSELLVQILDLTSDVAFAKLTLGVLIDEPHFVTGSGGVPTRRNIRIYGGEESCITFFKCRRVELDARVGVKVVARTIDKGEISDGVLEFVRELVSDLQVVRVKCAPADSSPWISVDRTAAPTIQDSYRMPNYLATLRKFGYKYALKTARFKVMERWEDEEFVYELSKNRNVDLGFAGEEGIIVVEGDHCDDTEASIERSTSDIWKSKLSADADDSGSIETFGFLGADSDAENSIRSSEDENMKEAEATGVGPSTETRDHQGDPFPADLFTSEPTVLPRKRKRNRPKVNPFRPRKRIIRHNQKIAVRVRPLPRPRAAHDQHMQSGSAYYQYTMVHKRMGSVLEKAMTGAFDDETISKEIGDLCTSAARQVLEVSREVKRFFGSPKNADHA